MLAVWIVCNFTHIRNAIFKYNMQRVCNAQVMEKNAYFDGGGKSHMNPPPIKWQRYEESCVEFAQ